MNVKYVLCNPTGNITALVESDIPVEKQPKVGEMIMEKEPTCEQVGFIMEPECGSDVTLRMAGGEFCGNATLSTAAWFCRKTELKEGEKKNVKVKVIGTDGILNVEMSKENGRFFGYIEMPKPISIKKEKFVFEGHNYWYPVVSFETISHVIIEDEIPVYMPESCIKDWCETLGSKGIGLMLLNADKSQIRPLVYVKEPESLVWESSCASGTSSVGAYLAKERDQDVDFKFKEPGGVLTVKASKSGEIILGGYVDF